MVKEMVKSMFVRALFKQCLNGAFKHCLNAFPRHRGVPQRPEAQTGEENRSLASVYWVSLLGP